MKSLYKFSFGNKYYKILKRTEEELKNMYIKNLKTKIQKALSAFTLMEMLITLTVIGIIMAASAPIISQILSTKSVSNKNVLDCIKANNTSAWFNTTTGVATVPNVATDAQCYAAVIDSQFNKGNALSTVMWVADKGNAAHQIVAKRILRAACDQGGNQACDYFINKCRDSGSTSSPYCDDTTNFADITYYLHQNGTTSAIAGASYIYTRVGELLKELPPNLMNEVTYACTNNQSPSQNQNLNANFACLLGGPQLYIKACNIGNMAACKYAYDNNYNRGCSQIKTNWAAAPTGAYSLTADGDPDPDNDHDYSDGFPTRKVVCNMASVATAAISGCGINGIPVDPVDADCTEGYLAAYNRACSAIFSYILPSTEGNYNLTSNGPPPAAPVATNCLLNSTCMVKGPGTKCPDGTIYLGKSTDGKDLFTTPTNQASINWLTRITELTGVDDPDNGALNTSQLLARTGSAWYPYSAAERCKALNDDNAGQGTSFDGGVTYLKDWYLPSKNELYTIMTNSVAIGGFTFNSSYWSSSEFSSTNAWGTYILPDTLIANNTTASKYNNRRVRCARKSVVQDMTCPTVGDPMGDPSCSNGTRYAGTFNGYHLYVPPTDGTLSYTTWHNGSNGITASISGLIDYNGLTNYGILTTEPVISNENAPYPAVNQCKALNDANEGRGTSFDEGVTHYKDWYLPARLEGVSFCLYKDVGDLKNTVPNNAAYWTSSPWSNLTCISIVSSDYKYCDSIGHCSDPSSDRNVRCIRRNP